MAKEKKQGKRPESGAKLAPPPAETQSKIDTNTIIPPPAPTPAAAQTAPPASAPATAPAPTAAAAATVTPAKKGSYDPVKAKEYRNKIKAAAIAGGMTFKEKGTGTGTTVKKLSKTGKEYYYQPWSQLTDEQKKQRLAQARERSAQDREMARKYKEEHPELFKKNQEGAA
jgi:hypothetical protein